MEPKVEEVVKDELTLARERAEKAEKDRDNYKEVALKRLGKLPGDAEFLDKDTSGEMTVAEQVRLALLDREVDIVRQVEKDTATKLSQENAELRLALKNVPGSGLGSGSETGTESKDHVFTEAQLITLRAKATRLNMDPEKYIENLKDNLSKNR